MAIDNQHPKTIAVNLSKAINLRFCKMSLLFWIGVTIFASLGYHLSQKGISKASDPMVSLLATYTVAIAICLVSLTTFPPKAGIAESFKQLNWMSYILGFAVLGIEIGYFFSYRLGWSISLGAIVPNAVLVFAFLPIDTFLLQKNLSLINILGILLCTVGLIFANR